MSGTVKKAPAQRPAAVAAEDALRAADAAVAAVKAEADRWGGSEKEATEPPERFW